MKEEDYIFRTRKERFELECNYIMGMVLRYIRRNYARILGERGQCDPARPGMREVLDIAGVARDEVGFEYLNNAGFPGLGDIQQQLDEFREFLDRRIEATRAASKLSLLMPEQLQMKFGLNDVDLHLLCAIAASQVSNQIARLYRFATGLDSTIFPASFYAELLSRPNEDADEILSRLEPDMPLRRYALVQVGEQSVWGSMTPVLHAPLFVLNHIASWLKGVETNGVLKYAKVVDPISDKTKIWFSDAFSKRVMADLGQQGARVGFYGAAGSGRSALISEYAANTHHKIIEIDLAGMPSDLSVEKFEDMARRWFCEARLHDALIVFLFRDKPNEDQVGRIETISSRLGPIIQHHPGTVVLIAQSPHPRWNKLIGEHVELVCEQPTQAQQVKFWRSSLKGIVSKDVAEEIVSYVSSGYCLTPGEVEDTVRAGLARVGGDRKALTGEVISTLLCTSRGRELEGLADLKPTPLGLNDIILNEDSRKVIDEILNYARYSEVVRNEWGFSRMSSAGGLSVLFSGPPGTGKTLTAGVIAHELRRALYVVDISRVVDKYIGETEKRLAKIFDHAQQSQAILLFDEADSLFAKRTNVKSSNDRYANLEVNYLLQRLEAYHGVTILTTNLATSLDEALARRIQFKLVFPMPDSKERAELWRTLMPRHAPCREIDYERLGEEFEMSGGHIKNAVFRACIMAASRKEKVDTEMLWDAGLHEYRELGHVVRDIASDEGGWD